MNVILLHQTLHTLPCDTACKHNIQWCRLWISVDLYSAECVYSRVQSATEQRPSYWAGRVTSLYLCLYLHICICLFAFVFVELHCTWHWPSLVPRSYLYLYILICIFVFGSYLYLYIFICLFVFVFVSVWLQWSAHGIGLAG